MGGRVTASTSVSPLRRSCVRRRHPRRRHLESRGLGVLLAGWLGPAAYLSRLRNPSEVLARGLYLVVAGVAVVVLVVGYEVLLSDGPSVVSEQTARIARVWRFRQHWWGDKRDDRRADGRPAGNRGHCMSASVSTTTSPTTENA